LVQPFPPEDALAFFRGLLFALPASAFTFWLPLLAAVSRFVHRH